MNMTRNRFETPEPPAGETAPNLNAERMEIPKFPARFSDFSLYIEEIHYRAETVTPLLKGIPGYLPGYHRN